VDRFMAVSNQVKNFTVNKFGIPNSQIDIVPNGLDLRVFEGELPLTRADFGIGDEDFVFLHVGSFNGPKNHNLMLSALIELCDEYPNFKLVFVGNVLD